VTFRLEGDMLAFGFPARVAPKLIVRESQNAQMPSVGEMLKRDARMVVYMHTAATARADTLLAGDSQSPIMDKCGTARPGSPLRRLNVMESVQAGRDEQKFCRMFKYQLPCGVSSYIIHDEGSPFDWVVTSVHDAFQSYRKALLSSIRDMFYADLPHRKSD